eukprot:GABW01001917.1.p1 GENE.GABW01001917.1~~GABW01001917.1.p1  ORF type:complete len:111 (-),score=30.95 GABW01001917.1:3-335(-)
MADEYKARGNEALNAGNYDEAIRFYTQGIEVDPTNHVLYSNRSAAYSHKGEYSTAVVDAEKAIELKPDWPRGYSRKATAQQGMNELMAALDTYRVGLTHVPNDPSLTHST